MEPNQDIPQEKIQKTFRELQDFALRGGSIVEMPSGFESWSKERQQEFIDGKWKNLENPIKSEIARAESAISTIGKGGEIIHVGDLVQWNEGSIVRQGKISSFSEIDKSVSIENNNGITRIPLANVELAKEEQIPIVDQSKTLPNDSLAEFSNKQLAGSETGSSPEPAPNIQEEKMDNGFESSNLEKENKTKIEATRPKFKEGDIVEMNFLPGTFKVEKSMKDENGALLYTITNTNDPTMRGVYKESSLMLSDKSAATEYLDSLSKKAKFGDQMDIRMLLGEVENVESPDKVGEILEKYKNRKTINEGQANDILGFFKKSLEEKSKPSEQKQEIENKKPEIKPEETPTPVVQEEKIPDWRESEEWKKFEMMREDLARYEVPRSQLGMSSIGLELKRSEYRNYKEAVAKKIRETLSAKAGANLTPEEKIKLEQEIHDTSNRELLDKEQDSYKKALQEHRSETLMDKAKEALKSACKTRVGQWYLRLPRGQRIALNFVLGTTIGIGLGATGSIGVASYAGARLARVGASFGGATAGTLIGEKKKSWSLEDLDKKEKEETGALENSDKSWEEKSKEFEEIKNKYGKERNKIKFKKAALTIGLGAGAGLFTGLTEQVIGKPNLEPPHVPKSPVPLTKEQVEKLFEDPQNLEHIKVEGKVDSLWKAVGKGMEENNQFKGLTEAQKQSVIGHFTNKAIDDPQKYGFEPDDNFGVKLKFGEEVNLKKLFNNTEEIKEELNKASKLSNVRQEEILERSQKIATYLKQHPNESLTLNKVSEILNTEPEIESEVEMPKTIQAELTLETMPPPEISVAPKSEDLQFENGGVALAGGVGMAGVATFGMAKKPEAQDLKKQIESEIDEAKKRLEVLERGKKNKQIVDQEPTKNIRSMPREVAKEKKIIEAVDGVVNSVYEKKGILGLGKTAGINTAEWREMKVLPAFKVFEFYNNPENSSLPREAIESLKTSEKHRNFFEVIRHIMEEEAGGRVKPDENNESVEVFVKRLAKHVLENFHYSPNKDALKMAA